MKGFIYAMLVLSAIVFLYRSHIGFPDLATSFGQLNAAYDSITYHTPIGDISANGEAQRYEAAAGNLPQNYYATSSVVQPSPLRGYPGN